MQYADLILAFGSRASIFFGQDLYLNAMTQPLSAQPLLHLLTQAACGWGSLLATGHMVMRVKKPIQTCLKS